jgi:hypothetical protein
MVFNNLCPSDMTVTIPHMLKCLLVVVDTILPMDCMVGHVVTLLIITEVLTLIIPHHITQVDLVEALDLTIITGVLRRRITIRCLHLCLIQVKLVTMVVQTVRTVTLLTWRDVLDLRLMRTILVDMELPILALRLLDTMEDHFPTTLLMVIPIQAQSPPLGASDPASLNLLPMNLARSAPLMELMERKTSPIFHWRIPFGGLIAVPVTVP